MGTPYIRYLTGDNTVIIKQFFFFFPRRFVRRTFSSKDCFTGQSPGIGHDASHLYTGGSRMCRGEGQVQAGLLTKGLEVCCSGGLVTSARISLMEGVLPSRLWQPDRSWSRRDAAKACMAACVSMALQRWIKALVREWRRRAGAWRALVRARSRRKVAASSLQRPPTSIPKTTRRHRRSLRSSG